jgi:hypothetical protein
MEKHSKMIDDGYAVPHEGNPVPATKKETGTSKFNHELYPRMQQSINQFPRLDPEKARSYKTFLNQTNTTADHQLASHYYPNANSNDMAMINRTIK